MFGQHVTTLVVRATAAGAVVAAGLLVGTPASAAPAPTPTTRPPAGDAVCPFEVTATWLRHRTTPNLGENALGQYPRRTVVLAKPGVVKNGFRQLDNGEWAFAAFLEPTGGACVS